MRGRDHQRGHVGGYVDPEAMVPPDHPLRQIRPLVNAALERLSPDFDELYSLTGRPSVPPEQLLRALLLQAFFTKNRDRLLEGDIAHGFLRAILADPQVKHLLSSEHFSVDGTLIEAWARLAEGSARQSLGEWPDEGSMKSFRPKDGSGEPPGPGRNGARDFHGETRSNETHA